jgi:hypothetical protein
MATPPATPGLTKALEAAKAANKAAQKKAAKHPNNKKLQKAAAETKSLATAARQAVKKRQTTLAQPATPGLTNTLEAAKAANKAAQNKAAKHPNNEKLQNEAAETRAIATAARKAVEKRQTTLTKKSDDAAAQDAPPKTRKLTGLFKKAQEANKAAQKKAAKHPNNERLQNEAAVTKAAVVQARADRKAKREWKTNNMTGTELAINNSDTPRVSKGLAGKTGKQAREMAASAGISPVQASRMTDPSFAAYDAVYNNDATKIEDDYLDFTARQGRELTRYGANEALRVREDNQDINRAADSRGMFRSGERQRGLEAGAARFKLARDNFTGSQGEANTERSLAKATALGDLAADRENEGAIADTRIAGVKTDDKYGEV